MQHWVEAINNISIGVAVAIPLSIVCSTLILALAVTYGQDWVKLLKNKY